MVKFADINKEWEVDSMNRLQNFGMVVYGKYTGIMVKYVIGGGVHKTY